MSILDYVFLSLFFLKDLTPTGTETEELIADAKKHEDQTHQEEDEVTRVDGEDSLVELSEQTITGSNVSDGGDSLEGTTLTPSNNRPTSLNVDQKTNTVILTLLLQFLNFLSLKEFVGTVKIS